ncbi:MAG: PEP-CTERM sorting domain-containing protein, partial [Lacipirellulaceae bacterium]
SHPDPFSRQIFGADLDFDQGRLLISGGAARDWRSYVPPGAAYLYTPIPEPASLMLLFLAGLASTARSRN